LASDSDVRCRGQLGAGVLGGGRVRLAELRCGPGSAARARRHLGMFRWASFLPVLDKMQPQDGTSSADPDVARTRDAAVGGRRGAR